MTEHFRSLELGEIIFYLRSDDEMHSVPSFADGGPVGKGVRNRYPKRYCNVIYIYIYKYTYTCT